MEPGLQRSGIVAARVGSAQESLAEDGSGSILGTGVWKRTWAVDGALLERP